MRNLIIGLSILFLLCCSKSNSLKLQVNIDSRTINKGESLTAQIIIKPEIDDYSLFPLGFFDIAIEGPAEIKINKKSMGWKKTELFKPGQLIWHLPDNNNTKSYLVQTSIPHYSFQFEPSKRIKEYNLFFTIQGTDFGEIKIYSRATLTNHSYSSEFTIEQPSTGVQDHQGHISKLNIIKIK